MGEVKNLSQRRQLNAVLTWAEKVGPAMAKMEDRVNDLAREVATLKAASRKRSWWRRNGS